MWDGLVCEEPRGEEEVMSGDTRALLVEAVENRTPDHIVAAGLGTDLVMCIAGKVEGKPPEAEAGGREG